jgi:hypothetical protein
MSEDLPGHLVQALVQTGNMASEKEMNNMHDQKDWS